MTRFIKWLIALILCAIAYFWFTQEKALPVSYIHASEGKVENIVANTRSGTVASCKRAKMSFPIGGTIANILVKEGDLVQKEQPLMSLWNADRLAHINEAKAQINSQVQQKNSICITAQNNQKLLNRTTNLFKDKLTSQESLDNAKATAQASKASCAAALAQIDVAEAVLNTTQANLEQTLLTAPFAGMVAKITGEIGEYSTPSPPGIQMPPAIDLLTHQCHYVSAPIDEVDIGTVKIGNPVLIRLDAFRDQTFYGKVKRIDPYVLDVAKQARTVNVEVTFNHQKLPNLLTGYSADIEIILAQKEKVIRLPTDLIFENRFVYLINKENRIEKRKVEIGLTNWQFTEIVTGINKHDKIVSSINSNTIKSSMLVTPVKSDD